MFGLSKRERYEREVVVSLHALFGDIGDKPKEDMIAPHIKEKFQDNWDGVIEEGIELSNSPELTATALAVIFYQDMFNNHLAPEDVELIRQYILENNYDDEVRPIIMFKIELFTVMAGGWADDEFDGDWFVIGLRDIHRAIFGGDDEHLDQTIAYFINGSNRIKGQFKSGRDK